MKRLTNAEEEVMQILWQSDHFFLRNIVQMMPGPKPHPNTVATILKILIEKGFVGIKIVGRQHEYYSLITKEEYSRSKMKQMAKAYFDGSFSKIVSFLVKERNISVQELEILLKKVRSMENPKK